MSISDQIEALHHSDQRAVRSVDSLTDDQWSEPSLLPGWTRAHVIAHLALNGEALARSLEGLIEDEVVPMYPSDEVRDDDIEELANEDCNEIRDRFFAATQHFRTTAAQLTVANWSGVLHRLPGGPTWPASTVVSARRREVEIHHADLAVSYSHDDWPEDFVPELLERVVVDHTDSPATAAFSVRADDLGRTWTLGAESPLVSGSGTDLAWWLVGRGHGEGLACGAGLPELGPWRRSSRA